MQPVWTALSTKPRRNFHTKVCRDVGISASCLPTIKSNSEIYGYVKNAGCSDCFRTIQHGCKHRKHYKYILNIYTEARSLLFRLHSFQAHLSEFLSSFSCLAASTPCLLSLLSSPFSIAGAMPWRLANQWRVGWPACGSTWACLLGRGHVEKYLWYRRTYLILMPFHSAFLRMPVRSFEVSSPVRSVKYFSCLAYSHLFVQFIGVEKFENVRLLHASQHWIWPSTIEARSPDNYWVQTQPRGNVDRWCLKAFVCFRFSASVLFVTWKHDETWWNTNLLRTVLRRTNRLMRWKAVWHVLGEWYSGCVITWASSPPPRPGTLRICR